MILFVGISYKIKYVINILLHVADDCGDLENPKYGQVDVSATTFESIATSAVTNDSNWLERKLNSV